MVQNSHSTIGMEYFSVSLYLWGVLLMFTSKNIQYGVEFIRIYRILMLLPKQH